MSRGQQTFRQRDATKLIKATLKAGLTVERVESDKDGKIIIVTKAEDAGNGDNPAEKNEWDGVLQ
jgi:nitrate reductase NapAB chaperone NapD